MYIFLLNFFISIQAGLANAEVGFTVWEWEYKVKKITMEHWNICQSISAEYDSLHSSFQCTLTLDSGLPSDVLSS